ncbi:hypothetical protein Rhopal_003559-T1 [Rhodotorula paludigena]|uniref:carnosine N-methyltransferase n=1 Tax=Rhodotorula paludigena TaxID=86838 RepID=A0AAV5GNG1_9BASI|nr:hypothetical protein Rhopal_003559-T1 [Rhodotorula paludigena]
MAHVHGEHSHSHGHGHSHDHAFDASDAASTSSLSEDHHQAVVAATFDLYRRQALSANQRRRADYYALPKAHRDLLPGYNALLGQVDEKLMVNAELVQRMINVNPFPAPEDAALDAPAPTESDHERLRSTLRQCARDWSDEGKYERETTYTPILDALNGAFADLSASEKYPKYGCLCQERGWEGWRGRSCGQANEFSLHMLIASSFILNNCTSPRLFPLHPYLHSFSNIRSRADLLEPCWIPDVDPSEIAAARGDFSFAAGDFLELYGGSPGSWDVCVTCFFLDTARNVVQYLETIHGLLKPGGLWVNCGPTLWHFENERDASSLELPLEDVKALARQIGFELSDEREVETSYTSNPRSLLRHTYTAGFWTARKVERTGANAK